MIFKTAKTFAKSFLKNGVIPLTINPERIKVFPGLSVTTVLYREGQTQIELIYLLPNVDIPIHCHPHVDAAELWVSGDGDAIIGNHCLPKLFDFSNLAKNLSRIPKGVFHGGKTGKDGVFYLSFQLWDGLEPSFIGDSWSSC